MMRMLIKPLCLGAVTLALVGTLTGIASAQDLTAIQTPTEPLILRDRGSFFIGGQSVEQTPQQLSSIFGKPLSAKGHVTTGQMYVEYMVPEKVSGVPVIMMHGGTLTGKGYDTTPDGRMGWYEYFVRRGHATYIPDQISRGRSGFDIAAYNDARLGVKPASNMPNAFRESDEYNWSIFRFGPRVGESYPDEQFPMQAVDELSKQGVPDFVAALPNPNPNAAALAALAHKAGGAVVMGHSETGALPLDVALTDNTGVRGLILIEPGFCGATRWTEQQIAKFAEKPILVLFGDHLDAPTGVPGFSWQSAHDDCTAFVARVNKAGGKATMLWPPALGIHGNSHLLMMDRNNLQIADLILKWIDGTVAQSH